LPAAQAYEAIVLRSVARTVLRAVDDAVAALADGYQQGQRDVIRQEEGLRREFIDDLLTGRGDLERLIAQADRFGLRLAGPHVVAVAAAGPHQPPLTDASSLTRRAEAEVAHRFGSHDVLVATKGGLLVCVVPATDGRVVSESAALLHRLAGQPVGVGRSHAGPTGVARSYEEARAALDLAGRLGLDDPVVEAASLLVYRMLLRDRAAIVELVDGVLRPLEQAGADRARCWTPWRRTSPAAGWPPRPRRLHVGVRTVTYRLARIRELTGYAANDPTHRFTLEAAVLGARLLGWRDSPIEPIG
ncbi:MAG TPA: helix-turn-helix domain-containing protein, partial [Actinomycetota bacterium]|nr:helix-turn-helix domain-containing protein [Actinomycetota bacterium]